MRKILVTTDFSENAFNANMYAAQLITDVETTFYPLHTYTPPIFQIEYLFYSSNQTTLGDPYHNKIMKQLKELKQRLQHEFKNLKHIFSIPAVFNTLTDEVLHIGHDT